MPAAHDVTELAMPTGALPASAGALEIDDLRSALVGPFSFTWAPGDCVAIEGPSGAGKSLFLRMLADLDPSEGEVRLDGVARSQMTASEWRRQVPYVAAESGWWADRVEDHFAPGDRARAGELAQRLGVGAAQQAGLVARLSTGERQRLALVRALVLDAPVLLLDEPTGPLDPAAVLAVEEVLRERLAAGVIICLVSHDPRQAERLRARRYRMLSGKIESLS